MNDAERKAQDLRREQDDIYNQVLRKQDLSGNTLLHRGDDQNDDLSITALREHYQYLLIHGTDEERQHARNKLLTLYGEDA